MGTETRTRDGEGTEGFPPTRKREGNGVARVPKRLSSWIGDEEGPQEISVVGRRGDVDASQKTLQRREQRRHLNAKKGWGNEEWYRLMDKEDLSIRADERITSAPGTRTPGTDGATIDGFSRETIRKTIRNYSGRLEVL
jgi:hypothetical protein